MWQHERIIAGFEAATGPDAVAFSVNLSKARQKLLLNHAEPANLFSRYIARQLRQVLGGSVPYGFVFDVGVEGQLHAHGVIIPVGERQIDVAALKTCLARAGGKIGGKAASRQVQTTPLYDGRGWAAYSLRNYDTVCQHLGTHKGGFLSTDLIRLAKKAFA